MRLHRTEDGQTVQYISDEEPEPLEVMEIPACSEEAEDDLLREKAVAAFPGDFTDIQLYKFVILHYADGKKGLLFCFQHFIIDGYSAVFALTYMSRVYHALMHGEELPEPTPEPWKQIEMDKAYQASKRHEEDLKHRLKHYDTEPQFTSVNGLGFPEFIEGKRYGKTLDATQMVGVTIRREIPGELFARIREQARKMGIPEQVFFALAVRSYLSRVCRTDDVCFGTPISSRANLVEKNCGLHLADTIVVRSIIPEDHSFAQALMELAAVQNDNYRHFRVGMTEMASAVFQRYGVPEGCVYRTFAISYTPPVEMPESGLDIQARYINNGWAFAPLYAQILPGDNKGGLHIAYVYAEGYTLPENVERFHRFMLRFIENGINGPDASLKDLIDKSMPGAAS